MRIMTQNLYKTIKIKLSGNNLEHQICEAYTVMLALDLEYPYLISARNFIPNILDIYNGEQQYLAFNRYRRSMYNQFGLEQYPTACGLGSRDLSYTLIYTRSKKPMRVISNPLQTEAFLYPDRYGKPQFTRAGAVGNDIIISGTASIRGSETLYVDDIEKQFFVTIENINLIKQESALPCDDLLYNVYVKHAADIDRVKQLCDHHGIKGQFYCVDICRDNLLLEIECFSPVFKF